MKRFFVGKENIFGDTIELVGGEFEHAKQVLRLKEQDQIVCFSGDETDYQCVIQQILSQKAICHIQNKIKNPKPIHEVALFLGALKLDKFEFVIQKMAELGLAQITPFESAYSVAKIKNEKIERYQKIALAASKQCGRADVLSVCPVLKIEKMIEKLKEYDIVIFANEHERSKALDELSFGGSKRIALVVGSEGGFSLEEAQKIASFATSVSLGKRILRAETAPITLASIVMFLLGELKN